jgi:hypothetical protein
MRHIVWMILAGASLGCGLEAQPQCSILSLRGTWSSVGQGTAIMTVPGLWPVGSTQNVVGLSAAVIDYSGRLSGPGTIIVGGVVLDYEMTGTMEITADCTGIMRYSVKVKGFPEALPGYVERFVFDPKRDELISVPTQSPISKPGWVNTMKRISASVAAVQWP